MHGRSQYRFEHLHYEPKSMLSPDNSQKTQDLLALADGSPPAAMFKMVQREGFSQDKINAQSDAQSGDLQCCNARSVTVNESINQDAKGSWKEAFLR